jgi:hypothetical protein
MATSSCDLAGRSTLLKKVKATKLAMSTRFEVAAMESLMGSFIGCFAFRGFSVTSAGGPGGYAPYDKSFLISWNTPSI